MRRDENRVAIRALGLETRKHFAENLEANPMDRTVGRGLRSRELCSGSMTTSRCGALKYYDFTSAIKSEAKVYE